MPLIDNNISFAYRKVEMPMDRRRRIVTDKQKISLIMEYEDILIGKRTQFSNHYFSGDRIRDNDIAIELFRYFFDYILCWDIDTIEQNLTLALLRDYKLDKLVRDKLIFHNQPNRKPHLVNKELIHADIQQILKMVYGDAYQVDLRGMVIDIYERCLKGNMKKYPKNYFSASVEGKAKACICLQYAINNQQGFRSVEEIYRMFADRNVLKLLDKWRLRFVAEQLYRIPIDYLHDALPDNLKDETFYEYYREQYLEFLEVSGRSF